MLALPRRPARLPLPRAPFISTTAGMVRLDSTPTAILPVMSVGSGVRMIPWRRAPTVPYAYTIFLWRRMLPLMMIGVTPILLPRSDVVFRRTSPWRAARWYFRHSLPFTFPSVAYPPLRIGVEGRPLRVRLRWAAHGHYSPKTYHFFQCCRTDMNLSFPAPPRTRACALRLVAARVK